MRVLFVCLGNICRSPTAEAVFRQQLREQGLAHLIECDSAGTAGYHIGKSPDPRTAQVARQYGYDMSQLRARQIEDADFERFDLILAMDRSNLAELRRRGGKTFHHKLKLFLEFSDCGQEEVPDPYYGGSEGFVHVLQLVEDACAGLIQHLREQLNA